MARRGRKRKSGARYPSGDRIPERVESPHAIALRQPHRRDAPLEAKHDQRAETPFGTLNLIGAISGAEYRAGLDFARIVRRWRAVVCAPKPHVDSLAGVLEPRPSPLAIDDPAERKHDYDAAFEALARAGQTAAVIVARVVVHEEPVPPGGFDALVRGLRMLRDHFGLR